MAEGRVLITGGAGFLGSHLCDRFLKERFHVVAMDNLITGDLRNVEHLLKHLNSPWSLPPVPPGPTVSASDGEPQAEGAPC